ncbi:MAG TPA: MFS transporter [Thermoanaerobaculia bacterium]|nr:MFS transporter [Thermoanaerobaculia bacterium]
MKSKVQTARWFVLAAAGVLYASEGFPYGLVTELFPPYLRFHGVSLQQIGLLNTVAFAWTAKFLWSPLVDTFGTYRRWISAALVALTASVAALAIAPDTIGPRFWVLATVVALASATQDIAVDAFTIRITSQTLLGTINAVRVTAYRGAFIIGGGGMLILAGRYGWRTAFLAGAALTALVFLITLRMPDDRGDETVKHDLVGGISRWFFRPRAATILAVVFLYRAGEFAVVAMIKPYWVDRGYTAEEIGTITTVVGVLVSIAGAFAGGWVVSRFGVWRALLWLGIAQTASNIGYATVATIGGGRWGIWAAAVVENFGYGLGTASFLAFLMYVCDREHAATEFALLTAAYGLTRTAVGSASGFLAQSLGYGPYFWLTVFLGIPALLLLPRIRVILSREDGEGSAP